MCDGALESFVYRAQFEQVACANELTEQDCRVASEHLTESAQAEAQHKRPQLPLLYLVRQLLRSIAQSTLQQMDPSHLYEQQQQFVMEVDQQAPAVGTSSQGFRKSYLAQTHADMGTFWPNSVGPILKGNKLPRPNELLNRIFFGILHFQLTKIYAL